MSTGLSSLLRPDADAAWSAVAERERAGDARGRQSASLEDRLRRGQRLSAEAAALRRAVRGGRVADA